MSCPICGPICHCDKKTEHEGAAEQGEQASRWPDPDAYDASEQQLAAKLNEYPTRHKPRPLRYPSLQLKFESNEPAWTTPTPQVSSNYVSLESTALDHEDMSAAP